MWHRNWVLSAAVAALAFGPAITTQADPILAVDFNGQWGNGTAPGFTPIAHNEVASKTIGDYTVSSNGNTWASGLGGSDYGYALYGDYVRGTDTGWYNYSPLTISVSGLAAQTDYDITLYSWNSDFSETLRFYQTGDAQKTVLGTIIWDNSVKPSAANPYTTTFTLASNDTGVLSVTAEGDASDGRTVSVVAAFTISAVPEPATFGLAALAGLLVLRRRR